jgi:hypothetical protein
MFRRIVDAGDGWLGMAQDPEETARSVGRIRALAAACGRDPHEIEIVMAPAYPGHEPEAPSNVREQLKRYDEAGVDEVALFIAPGRDASSACENIARRAVWVEEAAALPA